MMYDGNTVDLAWESSTLTVQVVKTVAKPLVERKNGTTLRRRLYSHTLGARTRYEITIASDEIKPNLALILSLLKATKVTLTVSDSLGATKTVECVHDASDPSWSYQDEIVYLPVLTLVLLEIPNDL